MIKKMDQESIFGQMEIRKMEYGKMDNLQKVKYFIKGQLVKQNGKIINHYKGGVLDKFMEKIDKMDNQH